MAVHTRLERMEEGVDAAHFMSVIATAEFFNHGPLNIVLLFLLAAAGLPPNPLVLGREFGAALIALAVVWIIYQVRTHLALAAVIVFTLVFSVLIYYSVISVVFAKATSEPTTLFWVAAASLLVLLAYIDYQFVRAGWSISQISEAERLVVRGNRQPTVDGYLMRLLGIPAICRWLDHRQRRISVALFVLATAAFCLFVASVWNASLPLAPSLEYTSRDILACFAGPGSQFCWPELLLLLWPFAVLSVVIGVLLLLIASLRFAARRFTRLSLERLISSDTRPVILFLRAFHDDQVKLRKPRRSLFRKMVSFGEPRPTLDHVLLEEGSPHGPVVAIGRPGSTPPFGAARTYVTDAEWREAVSDLSRQAGAVVITIDETEGVRWELEHLLGQNHHGKTLFLLPPRLTSPTEVSRVLPLAFADSSGRNDWIGQICSLATNERRLCIGWFWQENGQVEVLTSLDNSSLAYLVAVRTFLSATRSAGPPLLSPKAQV
jgi:hypothetical protein